MSNRGYFAIGIEGGKTEANVGTLWRSANVFGAAFIFTVGCRYKHQPGDTYKTPRHVPLFHFDSLDDMRRHVPEASTVVGVETEPEAISLPEFCHPERATYLLGAEDHGLSVEATEMCDTVVSIPSARSLNVAVAGSIVMYDRIRDRSE